MRKSWYLQSWFLCILFALWFFIIPLIVGVVLLVLSRNHDSVARQEIDNQISQSEQKNQELNNIIEKMGLMDAIQRQEQIKRLDKEIELQKSKCCEISLQIEEEDKKLISKRLEISHKIEEENKKLDELKKQIIITDEEILLQSFGLYKPKYEFTNSDKYHAELEKIRSQQKELIKDGKAATGNMNWTVNGSNAQGKKMVKDMQKLLIRAFNSECDEVVDRVKYNNFDSSLKRITSSYEAISKLGKIMDVAITKQYYNLKIDELTLALEYQQKKQQEKEEQKMLREQMREEERLRREIEETRRKVEKEQNHYLNALNKIIKQLEQATEAQREGLLLKKKEIEGQLAEIDKTIKDIDYREANQKAGYVYIISNVGSFGENVYKIGMTRRLNPEDRIYELGDASVPFNFDVHAMIFSDNAPALEAALHKAFDNKKLNMVNQRREFFNATLDEIKEVVKANFDKTAEFIDIAEAEQFRISLKMKEQLSA